MHRQMGEAAALISAFTWSCSSVALASLGARTTPAVLSALRLAFGSVVLILLLLMSGDFREYQTLSALGAAGLILSGILGYAVGDTLYIRALTRIGIQRTFPIVQALFILLSVAGGILILDESAGWGLVAGAALVGVGIYLVIARAIPRAGPMAIGAAVDVEPAASAQAPRTRTRTRTRTRLHGWMADDYWLLPMVGLTWACATILLAQSRGDLGAISAGTLRTPAGAFGLLAFTSVFQRAELARPFRSRNHIGAIAAAGILGTALGSLLYVYAVFEAGAARTVVLNATAPLMAVPLSIFFLGERFSRRIAFGTALSVLGIIFVVS